MKSLRLLITAQVILVSIGMFVALNPTSHYRGLPVGPVLVSCHAAVLIILARCLMIYRRNQFSAWADLKRKLDAALKRAEDLIECSSDMVWEIDGSGRLTFLSDHNKVMGDSESLCVGNLVTDLATLDGITVSEKWMHQLATNERGEPFRNFQHSLRRPDGTIAHLCGNGLPIRSETGELMGFRGTTRDRTAEVEALQTLNYQALHDILTGLPNRRLLMDSLNNGLLPPASCLAILQLDLDGFKQINDLYGHAAGDQLLCLVADRISKVVRPADFACRLGGDEFVIVMPGADADHAQRLAQQTINAMKSPFLIEGRRVRVGVSIGIAVSPDHGPASSYLLRLADQALYEVKRQGGNGLRIYREPLKSVPASRRITQGLTLNLSGMSEPLDQLRG